MTIEQARKMFEELEILRDEFNDRFRATVLKWEKILAREEVERDRWVDAEERKNDPFGIQAAILDGYDQTVKMMRRKI